MNVRHVIWASIVSTTISCQSVKKEYNSFDEYPVREDALTEMEYSPAETKFSLWAPTAEEVRVLLFESGNEGSASNTFPMEVSGQLCLIFVLQIRKNGRTMCVLL